MSWNDLNEVSQQTEKIMPWTVRHSLSLKYGAQSVTEQNMKHAGPFGA